MALTILSCILDFNIGLLKNRVKYDKLILERRKVKNWNF